MGLGRRAKDWEAYTESLLRMGEFELARGNVVAAKRYAVKVLRAVRRHGIRQFSGDARRILFRIAALSGDEAQMQALARNAMRAYGRASPRSLPFLLEVARAWVDSGAATRAESILTALRQRLDSPTDIAVANALMARAAATLKKRDVFDTAWSRAWDLLRNRPQDDPLTKAILSDLSSAASRIGDWERMGQALGRAGEEKFNDAR
jgi:hypothetical protein